MQPVATTVSQDIFERGAIRTALVARLSGATVRQLQYWHRTDIIQATVVGGTRGVPRLYSWIDYMKVRAAVKLIRQQVPTVRLRVHIDWLEKVDAEWYLRPLIAVGGRAHVAYDEDMVREAAPSQQMVMIGIVRGVIEDLAEEGALGALSEYSDAVAMDPAVRSGSPTVKGTRIETRHVRELRARHQSVRTIAGQHAVPEATVRRAAEFEERTRAA